MPDLGDCVQPASRALAASFNSVGRRDAHRRRASGCEKGKSSLFFVQSGRLPRALIRVRMNKSCLMMRCAQAQNLIDPLREDRRNSPDGP
jgi:hypothetical protein